VAPHLARTPAAERARARRSDAGVLVVGTLAKLMIFLAVLGTVGYDALSIAAAQVGVQDDAQAAALAGHDVLANHGTPQMAYTAVLAYADSHHDEVVASGFVIGADNAITVVLSRTAHTIVSSHLPRVKDYVVATATATVQNPLG
jgi:hypothetical protein